MRIANRSPLSHSLHSALSPPLSSSRSSRCNVRRDGLTRWRHNMDLNGPISSRGLARRLHTCWGNRGAGEHIDVGGPKGWWGTKGASAKMQTVHRQLYSECGSCLIWLYRTRCFPLSFSVSVCPWYDGDSEGLNFGDSPFPSRQVNSTRYGSPE